MCKCKDQGCDPCKTCDPCAKKQEVCGCKILVSSKCVVHEGAPIDQIGITTGDTLEMILIKISEYLSNLTEEISTVDVTEQVETYLEENLCEAVQQCTGTGNCVCTNPPTISNFSIDCNGLVSFDSENTAIVTIVEALGTSVPELVVKDGMNLGSSSQNLDVLVTGYSDSGCDPVVFSYTIECATCEDPIIDPSFDIDCNTGTVILTGSNIGSVSVGTIPGTYINGDAITGLTLGTVYSVVFNPSNTECDTITLPYTYQCTPPDELRIDTSTYTCTMGTPTTQGTTTISGTYSSNVGDADTINFLTSGLTVSNEVLTPTTYSFDIPNLEFKLNSPVEFTISNTTLESDTEAITYNLDCCADYPITNPVFSYNCGNGFVTFTHTDTPGYIPMQRAELIDLSGVSLGDYFIGSTHTIPNGTYTVVWYPKDTRCFTASRQVIINCP